MSDGRQHRKFVFECGVEVELKRVPMLTLQELGRQYRADSPPPKPPMQSVDYGNGPVLEPNESNPAYLRDLAEYEYKLSLKTMDLVLLKGIKCQVDQAALQEAKDEAEILGMKLEGDDRLLYIKHVLVGSAEELNEVREAIMSRGQPTEAAIAQKQEEFKSEVQGP